MSKSPDMPLDDESFARELEKHHDQMLSDQPDVSENVDERVESAMIVLRMLEDAKVHLDTGTKPTQPAGALETREENETADTKEPAYTDWFPLQNIGRFKIIEPLGRGGFGIVFRGRDPDLNRDVAIKVPRWEVTAGSEARRRFEREGQAAATLTHPGIVPVYEVGESGGISYLVTELVDGSDLATVLASGKTFSSIDSATLVSQLAQALEHAHQRGVLHRDVKPANVLLSREDSSPRIVDFGLAALAETADLTKSGGVVGTPEYMSPEQSRGDREEFGPPTDIYGLGAVLYELLAGRSPFPGMSLTETLMAVERIDPPPPHQFRKNVPQDLEAICLKCLEKKQTQRYPSALDLQSDLQRFLNGEAVVARPLTSLQKTARWCQRNPVVSSLATLLVAGLILAVSIVSYWWLEAEQQRALASERGQRYLQKSEQLNEAVDRLFRGLANHPEIRLASAEGLRKTLLEEASSFRQEFLSEEPEDPDRKAQYSRSLADLARINLLLGSGVESNGLIGEALHVARELPDKLIDERERVDWLLLKSRALTSIGAFEEVNELFQSIEERLVTNSELTGNDTLELPLRLRFELAIQRARSFLFQDQIEQATREAELALKLEESLPEIASPHSLELNSRLWNRAKCRYIVGETARLRGNLDSAIETYQLSLDDFEEISASSPHSDGLDYELAQVLHAKGISHARKNELALAREAYTLGLDKMDRLATERPLVRIYPALAGQIRYSLAASEMVDQRFDVFEQLITQHEEEMLDIIERFPDSAAESYSKLGDTYNLHYVGLYRQPDADRNRQAELLRLAQDAFDQSLEHNPKFRRAQMASCRVILNRAAFAHSRGEKQDVESLIKEGIARLDRIIDTEPNWSEPINTRVAASFNLGKLYSEQNRHTEAMTTIEKAAERFPDHPRAWEMKCILLHFVFRSGREEESIDDLDKLGCELASNEQQAIQAASTAARIASSSDLDDVQVEQLRSVATKILQSWSPKGQEEFESYQVRLRKRKELTDLVDLIQPGD